MFHSALIQYIPLTVSQLFLDDVELRGSNHLEGITQEQIYSAKFHVVHTYHQRRAKNDLARMLHRQFLFDFQKTKQSNNNFITDKGFINRKQDDAMQQICIPNMPESKTKIRQKFYNAATADIRNGTRTSR